MRGPYGIVGVIVTILVIYLLLRLLGDLHSRRWWRTEGKRGSALACLVDLCGQQSSPIDAAEEGMRLDLLGAGQSPLDTALALVACPPTQTTAGHTTTEVG